MNLKELESRLRSLLEGSLMGILPGNNLESLSIQKLAAALSENVIREQDGALVAPDVFTLIVHPDEASRWQDAHLLDALVHSIRTAGEQSGYHFSSEPTLAISTNPSLPPGDLNILASHRMESVTETKASAEDEQPVTDQELVPGNAFLIIEGVKVYPLSQPVVNIGRRLDNQLVIDDPRVSRNHAQLRVIKGRYVVFDLNSTGGTFVNGQRTNQSVLYPGDVISLAGVALIFGQDNPLPHSGLKDTAPLINPPGERPTVFFKDHSTAKIRKR